jgi:hypothetical protein
VALPGGASGAAGGARKAVSKAYQQQAALVPDLLGDDEPASSGAAAGGIDLLGDLDALAPAVPEPAAGGAAASGPAPAAAEDELFGGLQLGASAAPPPPAAAAGSSGDAMFDGLGVAAAVPAAAMAPAHAGSSALLEDMFSSLSMPGQPAGMVPLQMQPLGGLSVAGGMGVNGMAAGAKPNGMYGMMPPQQQQQQQQPGGMGMPHPGGMVPGMQPAQFGGPGSMTAGMMQQQHQQQQQQYQQQQQQYQQQPQAFGMAVPQARGGGAMGAGMPALGAPAAAHPPPSLGVSVTAKKSRDEFDFVSKLL